MPISSFSTVLRESRWPKFFIAFVLAIVIVHLYTSITDIRDWKTQRPWSSSTSAGPTKDQKIDMADFMNEIPSEPGRHRLSKGLLYSTMDAPSQESPSPAAGENQINIVSPTADVPTSHTHRPLQTYVLPSSSSTSSSAVPQVTAPSRISLDTVDYQTGLDEYAHRIRDPDLFEDHFKAVLSLDPVSMEQAKSTCGWPDDAQTSFMYHESLEWVQTDVADSKIDEARKDWQDFMRSTALKAWNVNKSRFRGRGIVIVGGHPNTIRRIKLQLKMLQAFNSRLPVEIHHWKDEIDEMQKWELQSLYHDLVTVDMSRSDNLLTTEAPVMIGYHMKVNAVINSGFAEVLLLDADNIPMYDPNDVFESETYQEFGTVFWPDVPRTRINNPMWSTTNTHCRMDEYEQESGQMLVDKRRFFYHLQLSSFMMTRPNYSRYLLGDKDMFRFAWHALKTTYGRPARWVASIGSRYVNETEGKDFFCGRSFAQFHPDSKNGSIAFLHLNALKRMQEEVFDYYRAHGGLFQWYKSPIDPYNWSAVEEAGHRAEETPMMDHDPELLSICIDFWNSDEVPSEDIIPGFDAFFNHVGGYDMLAETVGRA